MTGRPWPGGSDTAPGHGFACAKGTDAGPCGARLGVELRKDRRAEQAEPMVDGTDPAP